MFVYFNLFSFSSSSKFVFFILKQAVLLQVFPWPRDSVVIEQFPRRICLLCDKNFGKFMNFSF